MNSPAWLFASGLPSTHATRAAHRVAATIDPNGSLVRDLRETYLHHASNGMFIEADLILGEQMLLDLGLVRRRDDHLLRTAKLNALLHEDDATASRELIAYAVSYSGQDPAALGDSPELALLIPDQQHRTELLTILRGRYDDTRKVLIGEIGEEIVLAAVRRELIEAGQADSAGKARRVSLQSDAFGYDVLAPRLTGPPRLLEVKASTRADISFVLTRNEAAVGSENPADWFLVFCRVEDTDARAGTIIGWSGRGTLASQLPEDRGNGQWQSVRIALANETLISGLPDY